MKTKLVVLAALLVAAVPALASQEHGAPAGHSAQGHAAQAAHAAPKLVPPRIVGTSIGFLDATLPFWPLLAAIAVGILLIVRRSASAAHAPAHGHGHDHGGHGGEGAPEPRATHSAWIAIGGVAVSALLALHLMFVVGGAKSTEGVTSQSVPNTVTQGESAQHMNDVFNLFTGGDQTRAPVAITHTIYNWIGLGNGQWIGFNYYLDSLTGIMLFVVTFVGLMVVIYSMGYMRDHHGHPERGYERFFAFLALFVFSMCMLVLAGNFVLLYLGWELVGLCSYLLIGFYFKKPEAAAAAKKAFLVNRIGDFGFALGIFALYMYINPHVRPGENPLDYAVAFKYAALLTADQATTISLLLFCGALGKSAQIPLYVWLPDAMEGPSPVSALIHAATMVTAGVYMVARCGPIFAMSPVALNVVMAVGAIGAFFAATMAMAQYDMKRILAYSTMSQLAYMFVGLGCAAPGSAVFHLYTHAFFKALLFLTAGNVMHAMGNVIDVRRFSGLRSVLPQTYRLMGIGCLALAGFPLLSGFWSKDEIVHAAWVRNPWLGGLLLLTAGMTAYYTFRMFFLCFHGPKRLPKEAGDHPHEMPSIMLRPQYVLAVGAVLAGGLGLLLGFHRYLESSTIVSGPHHEGGVWLMVVSSLVALAGIGLAYLRYGQAPQVDPDRAALGEMWQCWHDKYYIDEIYDLIFVRPLRWLGNVFYATDRNGINGIIGFVAAVPRGLGAFARVFQGGALQAYALGMVVGVAGLLLLWRWMSAGAAG